MSPDNLTPDSAWKFAVTKDDQNPIVLHFDTCGKIKRAATPAFLMALVLKEHIKFIKAATGVTPTELGFTPCFGYSDDERLIMEKGLEESCRLLEIMYKFLETPDDADDDEI